MRTSLAAIRRAESRGQRAWADGRHRAVGRRRAGAQPPRRGTAEAEQIRQRQRISLMEGVLERAVANGADNLLRQVKHVMPDVPMLTGAPEVRGLPARRLRRVLRRRGAGAAAAAGAGRCATWSTATGWPSNAALAQLRAIVLEQPAQERARLETLRPPDGSSARLPSSASQPRSIPAVVRDPNEAYTRCGEGSARGRDAREQRPAEPRRPTSGSPWRRATTCPTDPLVPGDRTDVNTRDLPRQGQRPGRVPRPAR